MSAHPMICPLPGVGLAHVQQEFDADAAKLFELITDEVSAFTSDSRQRQVELHFPEEPQWVLTGTTPCVNEQQATAADIQDLRFDGVRTRSHDDALTIDALLDWIAHARLMSPARMSVVFQELYEAGWLSEQDGDLSLTPQGQAQLDIGQRQPWSRLNPESAQAWRQCCEQAATAQIDLPSVLHQAHQLFGVNVAHRADQIMALIPSN